MEEPIDVLINQLKLTLGAVTDQWRDNVPAQTDIPAMTGDWTKPTISLLQLHGAVGEVVELLQRNRDGLLDQAAREWQNDFNNLFMQLRGKADVIATNNAATSMFLNQLDLIKRSVRRSLDFLFQQPVLDNETEGIAKEVTRLKEVVRTLERRLSGLNASSMDLGTKIKAIDLGFEKVTTLQQSWDAAQVETSDIRQLRRDAEEVLQEVRVHRTEASFEAQDVTRSMMRAQELLEASEAGYRAITSQGLASAFANRSKSASYSMIAWTVGLVAALCLGGWASTHRFDQLFASLGRDTDSYVVPLQLAALALTAGATVWFGWLASLQIGYRFRLAEDYAYKASISTAYEGYRKEAARADDGLDRQLLATALATLAEIPLRVVDPNVHGSPLHAIVDSEMAKRAASIVPSILDRILPKSRANAAAEKSSDRASAEAEQKQ